MDRCGDQVRHHLSSEATRRRPWFSWAPPFAVLFALLCVRNRFLFSARLYEQGDAAANSILITQAKHFTLLIGNYSREGFNHPGPAYLYVQAAGEWLFQDTLHLVPTAWNAHMLAVFALNCASVSLCTMVIYGWTRSVAGVAACCAVVVAFVLWQPWILNSDWMPNLYVMTYVVFVIAAGSVAVGAARDIWILTLSGWLLIHGHACFLFIVPLIVVATAVIVMWRFGWRDCLRTFAQRRGIWLPVAVISAVFLLPILLNLALHWPGDFAKYFSYGKSGRAGGHGPRQILHYLLWFWWPHSYAWVAVLVLVAAAVAVAWWLVPRAAPLRRFLIALLLINGVSTAAVIVYAAAGIDDLSEYYITYFYWSAPLVTVLVIVLGLVSALPPRTGLAVAMAAAVASCTVLAVRPATRAITNDIDEALPGAVATLGARAPGRTIVLHIQHNAWPQTAGFLVQAERTGVHACVDDSSYTFLFSRQFICTPAQVTKGVTYEFDTPAAPAGSRVLLSFHGVSVLASGLM